MSYVLTLDWYKLVFLAELFVAEGFLAFKLERRKWFLLRLILSLIGAFALAYFMPVLKYDALNTSITFLLLFLISVGALFACFKSRISNVLFCAISAYTIQHLAYQVLNFILIISGLVVDPSTVYGNAQPENVNFIYIPIYVVSYFAVYWLSISAISMAVPNRHEVQIKSFSMLGLVFVVLAVDIFANAFIVYAGDEDWNATFLIASQISSICCCVMTLWIQCSLVESKKLKTELESIYQIYSQEQKQYAVTQTNIDLINQKCHDLKYQIRAIAQSGEVKEEIIKEIEDSIYIYDSVVKTGNQTLDVILTEKSLVCRKNSISFTCVVDGNRLNFINAVDLFTLFGNAIDNAIEAVSELEEDYRVISLTTKLNGNIFSVTLRNYYAGELKFNGTLPQTTKNDKAYHGFGLKSIKQITERYGGDVYVNAEDGVFNLNLLFFVCEEN